MSKQAVSNKDEELQANYEAMDSAESEVATDLTLAKKGRAGKVQASESHRKFRDAERRIKRRFGGVV